MAKRAVMVDSAGVEWRYENYEESMRNPQSPDAFMLYNHSGGYVRLFDVIEMYGIQGEDFKYLITRDEEIDG